MAVTRPRATRFGGREVEAEIAAVDRAYSRFRADSELVALYDTETRVAVSQLLGEALEVAIHAFEVTGGAVDPTVGASMAATGYDRDFAELVRGRPTPAGRPAVPGIEAIWF